MKTDTNQKFLPVSFGTLCRFLYIPEADKELGDPRNLLALVMDVTADGFYQLGTVRGILNFMQDHNSVFVKRACSKFKMFLTTKYFFDLLLLLLSPQGVAKDF